MNTEHPLVKPTIKQQLPLYVMALAIIAADQLSKWWIETNLELGEVIYPFPNIGQYFNILHVANRGAAFGFFQGGGWFFSVVAFIVTAGILYYNTQLPPDQRAVRLTMGFMLGGALGNVIDRFRIGHVTDFLHINLRPLVTNYPALDFQILDWPIFNIADMSIVFGVLTLVYLMYKEEQAEQARQAAVTTRVEADLTMAAAARRLPQLYSYEPGWTAEPLLPQSELGDTSKARFAFLALIGLVVSSMIALTVILMSASNARRRRKRLKQRARRLEEQRNG